MRAIVVGAGIGGLCAAIGLRRAGIETSVYEKVDELREIGAGLSLWANALAALDALGLGQDVRAVASPGITGSGWDYKGRVLVRATSTGRENMVILHRGELQSLLLAALGSPGVRCGAPYVGHEETPNGVRVRFGNGEVSEADLLIGADGLHSAVRAALHGPAAPVYAGYTAWRGVVEFPLPATQAGETWGRGERFGTMPMSRGRVYWFATANAAEGESDAIPGRKARLLERFGPWHAPIPQLLAATDEAAILRNDIYDRPPLTRWSSASATLLGDAAHPTTPNLGQGACQAIEDAAVLAHLLRDAAGGDSPDISAVLQRYDAARIPRTTRIVNLSRTMGRVGQFSNPILAGLRDTLVKLTPPSVSARQLEWITTFPGV